MTSVSNAARAVQHSTLRFSAPPARVFPLLCPVREHDWLDTWRARVVHSDSGVAEDDCVFVQADPAGAERVWSVSRHEPEQHVIEFVAFTPGLHVMKLEVALFADGAGTRAEWHRTLTALSDDGERAVEAYAAGAGAAMKHLETQLEHYLCTGRMLRA